MTHEESAPLAEGAPSRPGGPKDILTPSTDILRDVSDDGRFVKVPALEFVELVVAASQWQMLRTSPHVASLLDEWAEWDRRRQLRESSWDISEVSRGRWEHLSYAAIERRRNEVVIPEWAKAANAMLARRRGEAA